MQQKYVEMWAGPADGFSLRVPVTKKCLFVATSLETNAFRVIEDNEEAPNSLIGIYRETQVGAHRWEWGGYSPTSSEILV